MPSVNKTPNLGLNNWDENDKPKRMDFVEDNQLLDTILHSHFQDTDLHFTPEDRSAFHDRIVTGTYLGNGEASRTLALSFSPRACFIFAARDALQRYDAQKSYTVVNSGVYSSQGSTIGVTSLSNAVMVEQSQDEPAAGACFLNLNAKGSAYFYVALR